MAAGIFNSTNGTAVFATNRSAGYNCSHPLQAVAKVDSVTPGGAAVPASLMGQMRPERYSLKNAWPRHICPVNPSPTSRPPHTPP